MSTIAAVHADTALPGLAIALHADALLQTLAERLPECRDEIQLLDAAVADVQYTPGSGARVLWKVRAYDRATGRTGRQHLYIRALGPDEATPPPPAALMERYRARRRDPACARLMPLRTPWFALPDLGLVLHAYPLDPALPTLLDVTDPIAMRTALHRSWQPRGVRVRRVQAGLLSYTPEARAALRFEVLSEDRTTGMPELRRLVGKLHINRSPARLFAGHWAVWRGTSGQGIAPPAGYVSVAQLSLQEFLTGTRLSDLAGKGTFHGLVRRTAHVISRVHGLTLPVLSTRGVDKEVASVDRWSAILCQLRPAQAARIEGLRQRLRRELAARTQIAGTVHADFHLANVLADERGVMVIDWDQAAHGDPMVDVGRVLASLRVSSLRVHGSINGFAAVEDGFLEAYLQRTGADERRARLFEATSLLVSAAAPFRLQRSGWEEGAELMLDEVQRILALSVRSAVSGTGTLQLPQPTGPEAKRQVAFGERTAWALDPTFARTLLVPVVHETEGGGIEVTECHPRLLEQAADRVHLQWTLKGYSGADRWRSRVEGMTFASHSGRSLLRRLTAAHAAAEGVLTLPRPIGFLEPLSTIVFVPAPGEPVQALPTEAAADALRCVGEALAELQRMDVVLGRERSTDGELRSAERRVLRLEARQHALAPIARRILLAAAPRLRPLGERRMPSLAGLTLQRLRVSSHGVGAAIVDDAVAAEPLWMVAGLLSDLRLADADTRAAAEQPGPRPGAAAVFAESYLSHSGEDGAALDAAEALLLVRGACAMAKREPARAALLLAAAEMLTGGRP